MRSSSTATCSSPASSGSRVELRGLPAWMALLEPMGASREEAVGESKVALVRSSVGDVAGAPSPPS
eukprot:1135103-Alexandrium_andersonii.AAC.1